MTPDQITLEKHLKKATIWANSLSVIFALAASLSVGYGFYYNTKSTLQQHSNEIQEVKVEVEEIQNDIQEVDVFKGVSEFEVKALEEKITKIEDNVSKMDEKLDKILMQTRR